MRLLKQSEIMLFAMIEAGLQNPQMAPVDEDLRFEGVPLFLARVVAPLFF